MLHYSGIRLYNPNDKSGTVVLASQLPLISSRWTPGQIERRDTAAGTFECVNPRDFSNDALWLQQALFYKPAPKRFCPSSVATWTLGVFGLWALIWIGANLL